MIVAANTTPVSQSVIDGPHCMSEQYHLYQLWKTISDSNQRPCGDGARCYHRLDSCWEAACLNVDCFADHVLISDSITELDKTQVNTKYSLEHQLSVLVLS